MTAFISACRRRFSSAEVRDEHEDHCLVCMVVEEDEAFEDMGFGEFEEDED